MLTADAGHDDMNELVRGPTAVVHLAWLFQSTHRPVTTWSNNVLGAAEIRGRHVSRFAKRVPDHAPVQTAPVQTGSVHRSSRRP